MAKFSFHCQPYKRTNLAGLDKHNRRQYKHHSNKDIDDTKSINNRIYVTPDTSLYQACKKQIEERVLAHGGRITKASNWICECIFSYPEELSRDRMDEYYGLVLEYMASKLGRNNIVSAIVHMDEGGLPHMHLDVIPITSDNRLSSKNMITKEFIQSVHDEMPRILKKHGFEVERGSSEHETAGLSAKEYKKRMKEEATVLDSKLTELTSEYNSLVEKYNRLIKTLRELEKKSIRKAYEIINNLQRAR